MWRRTYLLLLIVRVYFALSPSYLHPDENFQGPEVIAGSIFPYPSHKTWEWTCANPVRSLFPLWPLYGLPMKILQWVWAEEELGLVGPDAIYYALRIVMFMLSFVLEDWAVYELVRSPKHRKEAVALVASSYVTWTFQTHTFSNSLETLLVAWSLVLIERIVHEKKRSSIPSCIVLALLLVSGIFNRITFPAFVLIPGLQLLPHFLHRPFTFLIISGFGIIFTFLAVAVDTAYYTGPASTKSFRALFSYLYNNPVITPLNSLRYNTQTSNLTNHGLHPHYQHIFVNAPQLLGPAFIILVYSLYPFSLSKLRAILANSRLTSALTGTLILSLIPHQEPRFLIPCIPLLLTCIRFPSLPRHRLYFWISWVAFNSIFGTLMGVYHQGGVIPAQLAIPSIVTQTEPSATETTVFWWKTYPPPTYLLGSPTLPGSSTQPVSITTVPLMGISAPNLYISLLTSTQPRMGMFNILRLRPAQTYLAAPLSAHLFDMHTPRPNAVGSSFLLPFPTDEDASHSPSSPALNLTLVWSYARHLNLDDIDVGEDGIWGTLRRVVGRRGIGVWHVTIPTEDKT